MSYYYIFLGVFAVLMAYVFYHQVAGLRWDSLELNRLEYMELSVAHILRLLDAPDVKMLLRRPKPRQYLFLEFSKDLKKDMKQLVRWRALGMGSLAFVVLFYVCYYLLRMKARLVCSPRDLHFLSGLELALFRSMRIN
jgi:hypothetical protein